MRFWTILLFLSLADATLAAEKCPLNVPAGQVPYYAELYGTSSKDGVLLVNTRIQAEEENLRAALRALQIQHPGVVTLWPERLTKDVVVLEDASFFRLDRSVSSTRTLRLWYTDVANLACLQLEYMVRDHQDPQRWVRKVAWLDPRTLEMQVSVAGHLPTDTDEKPDRVADMAPHIRVEALRRMARYVREARYTLDMQMTKARSIIYKQHDKMVN